MSFYLAIVSPQDAPLYELAFPSSRPAPIISSNTASSSGFPSWSSFANLNGADPPGSSRGSIDGTRGNVVGQGGMGIVLGGVPPAGQNGQTGAGDRALWQMIAFKALDGVEEVMEGVGTLSVDKHNEWTVSAFLAMGVKFILLHDHKNDDGIRLFFLDVWELWVKMLLNPFHTVNTPIRSPAFEQKMRTIAKRHL